MGKHYSDYLAVDKFIKDETIDKLQYAEDFLKGDLDLDGKINSLTIYYCEDLDETVR